MWAGAQSTPMHVTSNNALTWNFNSPMPITTTTIAISNGAYQTISSIAAITLTPYLPNSSSESMLLSGKVTTNLGYAPAMGVVYYFHPYFIMQINIGTSAFTCIVSIDTSLNGTCAPSDSGKSYSVTYNP